MGGREGGKANSRVCTGWKYSSPRGVTSTLRHRLPGCKKSHGPTCGKLSERLKLGPGQGTAQRRAEGMGQGTSDSSSRNGPRC